MMIRGKKNWLLGLTSQTITTKSNVDNVAPVDELSSRDYVLKGYKVEPKIAYLFSRNASWDLFCEFQNKENRIGNSEELKQTKIGTSFTYASEKKLTMNGEFSLYQNKFKGDELSVVAFQMLEGLQVGQNLTWRLLIQRPLTQFLDININYQGRKSETSQTIHTGNVQLRAYF